MGSPLSPLAMLPALAFFLSPTSSARTTPSRSSSSFFARDSPPPPPASTTARRASEQQHQHHEQHQLELECRLRQPQPPPAPTTALDLHLTTNCTACGEPVAVEVPRWILAAMEGAQQQRQHLLSGPAYREDRGRGAPSSSAAEWRERIVSGAVGAAQAVKASPLPGLILAFLRTLFAFLLYLDERFSIHQRIAVALGMFLEGLVEIEREVGVMKGAGEALSIGWEATVKGIIAFAKAGAADGPAQYGTSSRARNESHTPRASSPAGGRGPRDSFSLSGSPPHLPSYETTDADFRYYDSVSTTRIPSPVLGPTRALHRNFVSSPSLQSAYLSSLSPSASPHLAATATSPTTDSFPMTPSDALLSPFDPASQPHGAHGVRPRMVRQRSATGPDQVTSAHDVTVQAPPPSPSSGATRGGWAGKAVLGLAERMKVL
ncbi:hypothetical protein JCM9279_001038 [Rhodotorula babjevae]